MISYGFLIEDGARRNYIKIDRAGSMIVCGTVEPRLKAPSYEYHIVVSKFLSLLFLLQILDKMQIHVKFR